MPIKDKILEYFRDELLPEYGVTDVAEVIDYEDVTVYGGYCDTCAYEDIRLQVTYKNAAGEVKTHRFYDSLASILRYA